MLRSFALAAMAACAAIMLLPAPSMAVQPVADPSAASSLVTPVAERERAAARRAEHKTHHVRVHRNSRDGYVQNRLNASRWLHYQYVNAGYPAWHYEGEVYYTAFPGDDCCGYRRYWPWMGHYHRGPRYWLWMGHNRHHDRW